jgi:integrase/recombinase XerD
VGNASRRFIEFFTATIRNRNTRMAYARAVKQFFEWCDERRLELADIEAITVATYMGWRQQPCEKLLLGPQEGAP